MKKKEKSLTLEEALKTRTPIDPSLNSGKVLFPEELEKINAMLRMPGAEEAIRKIMKRQPQP